MPYAARKPMTLSGRSYKAGDVVDTRKLAPSRLRQMIDQRRIVSVPKKKRKPAAKTAKASRTKPTKEG